MDRIIREAVEIKLHLHNVNGEDGFCLSRTIQPLVHTLKEWKNTVSKDKTCMSP
jgi:hypothetical protein